MCMCVGVCLKVRECKQNVCTRTAESINNVRVMYVCVVKLEPDIISNEL